MPSPETQDLLTEDLASTGVRAMSPGDLEECVDLISRAMDPDEGRYAQTTFDLHFGCQRHGVDDGRRLYVSEEGDRIVGIVGLHFYAWGPPENVWLSWFAVDPDCQGAGYGRRLLNAALAEASRHGHSKMLIETYSSTTFTKATRFYLAQGFAVAGTVADYLPDGSSMVVLSRSIQPAREDDPERNSSPDS